jgi:hypothetical protein
MAGRSRTNLSITSRKSTAGSRAIWKVSIDFGLINIPVRLYSAASLRQMNFDMLDKRDFARIRSTSAAKGAPAMIVGFQPRPPS